MPLPHEHLSGNLLELSPVLLAALEQTRSSACITTADLDEPGPTIVYVNPAYCAMTGRTRAEVLGRSPRLMQGPLTDRRVLDELRDKLRDGQPFSGETINYRSDGTPFLISWSIDPVRAADGEITHFVATQQDVTEQARARNLIHATQLLDRALTDVLNSSLERATARQELVDAIVLGATRITRSGTIVAVLIDDDDATQTVAGECGDPTCLDDEADTVVRIEFSQTVSQSRGWILVRGLSESQRAFVDIEGLERYSERVASVTGSLFEYQRQRDAAIRLQRSLLPRADLVVPDFDIATTYLPGAAGLEVGGDWFDAVTHRNILTISVGDVSGSGIDAAALMGRLRQLVTHELERGTPIGEVLTMLDAICRDASQMATLLMAQIDMSSGATQLWSAGHLPPILVDDHTASLQYFDVAPPLGFLGKVQTRPEPVQLDEGHCLFLFTDGLVERRNEIITEGLNRLCAAIEPGQELRALLDSALNAAGSQIADDIAMIAVRRCTLSS